MFGWVETAASEGQDPFDDALAEAATQIPRNSLAIVLSDLSARGPDVLAAPGLREAGPRSGLSTFSPTRSSTRPAGGERRESISSTPSPGEEVLLSSRSRHACRVQGSAGAMAPRPDRGAASDQRPHARGPHHGRPREIPPRPARARAAELARARSVEPSLRDPGLGRRAHSLSGGRPEASTGHMDHRPEDHEDTGQASGAGRNSAIFCAGVEPILVQLRLLP